MSDAPNISELRAKTQRDRLEFLQTDLALCLTFANLAQTELVTMDDREAAISVYVKAEEGHATITRLLLHVDDNPEKDAIRQGLLNLHTKLDTLQQRLYPAL